MATNEELRSRIDSVTRDGRITCTDSLAIARDLDIPSKDVGAELNEMGIKIVSCQLGCFP